MVVYVAFAVPATLAYVATIALIVATKSHRQFIHRLRLYLAIAGLLHAVAIALEVLPADISRPDDTTVRVKSGWDGACVFFGAFGQYCSILGTLVTSWISFYVFMLVTFQSEKLKQRKHEIVGLIFVLCVPLLLTWEPFIGGLYGLAGTSCWISDDYGRNTSLGSTMLIAVNSVPITLMTAVSILLLVAATVLLIRGAVRKKSYLRKQHWKALKGVIPLMLFPSAFCLSYVVGLIFIALDFLEGIADVVVVSLIQSCSFALLASLFLHANFHANCRTMCSARGKQHEVLPDEMNYSETTPAYNSVQHKSKDLNIY